MKRFILSLLVVGFVVQLGWSQVTDEQRDRRRAFLEGLLRTVVESQIPELANPPAPQGNLQPPGHRPQMPPGHRPGHGHQHQPPVIDQQVLNLKRSLQSFSGELDGLITQLQQEERYSPAIRPLLGDAVRIKSSAEIMLINTPRFNSLTLLAQSFEAVDQQWRVLAHRLRHVQNLSSACRASVGKVAAVEQSICKQLGIEPQLDRNSLITDLIALRTNLANLLNDVAVDVRDMKLRSQILVDGRRVQSEIDETISRIGRHSSNADIVKEYQEAYKLLSELAVKLRQVGSVSIARNLQQIDKLNMQIHELLWLDMPIDRAALEYYARTVQYRYDNLCDDLSLLQILKLPDPPKTTAAMGSFRGLASDFAKSVTSGASDEDLRWDYRSLNVEWNQIEAVISKINEDRIIKHLASISDTIDVLRDALHIRPEFDRDMAASLSGDIDMWSVRYEQRIRSLVYRPGMYPPQEAMVIASAANSFHEAAHRLNESIIRGESVAHLRPDCVKLADAWQKLAVASGKLVDEDRISLAQTTEQIVPQIAKLQILLAY